MSNIDGSEAPPQIFWRIDEWFPDLSPEVRSRLKAYHEELQKFNRTLSLISAKSVFVADALHFADSINASKAIIKSNPNMDKVYDFGSGNGFPGIVFGIMNPNIQVVLVDTDVKKCEFLGHAIQALKLKNVTVENKNIEALPADSVKWAICRGFGNISKAILMARKIVVKGGSVYHLKGEEWGIEVGEIPTQLCSIWSPSLVGEYKLPVGAVKYGVVRTEKIS
ncbi:16S rRNA (guanine(527)-N(7))-methyltransferase RsmG [Bdellovibrio sp. ZAP7]|uniref:16S rRNA (guanine(527)-N(7))-methyltransferase RsmG n=1 Tax=Bdellovibrio sp. ZAP7 TaxID=2231053 RepID=UPI001158838B|nr:16S rRNA (guanine(527)-N(7))-methyltransferase RsmG [Bdellovibrio sp. ZAP7]QDK47287.1 16S rRNA (guanine(527)-N(7))-methyltransferase RsmG [Bdellovibrio sp. ZAP7]